jgi:hypothetical protein
MGCELIGKCIIWGYVYSETGRRAVVESLKRQNFAVPNAKPTGAEIARECLLMFPLD